MQKVEVHFEPGQDWGRGAWVATLSIPTEAADWHVARAQSKRLDEAVASIGTRVSGWVLAAHDADELAEIARGGGVEPWSLVFEGSDEHGWIATATGPNGLFGEATHTLPHEALMRAIDKAFASGARFV